MQEVVGSNPNEGKICFSQLTPFYGVECEKIFCKTNLKRKCIKLIKTKINICFKCSNVSLCRRSENKNIYIEKRLFQRRK